MLGFISFMLIAAIGLVIIGGWAWRHERRSCPKYRYVYKPYVRTFTEEQTEPASVFKMYQDMFWKQSPWVSTWSNPAQATRGYINPFVWGDLPTTDLGTVRESNDFVNSDF